MSNAEWVNTFNDVDMQATSDHIPLTTTIATRVTEEFLEKPRKTLRLKNDISEKQKQQVLKSADFPRRQFILIAKGK